MSNTVPWLAAATAVLVCGGCGFAAERFDVVVVGGFFRPAEWQAHLDRPVEAKRAEQWIQWARAAKPEDYSPGTTTAGQLLGTLYKKVRQMPPDQQAKIQGEVK